MTPPRDTHRARTATAGSNGHTPPRSDRTEHSDHGRRITRADLEAAFSRAFDEGESTVRQAAPQAAIVAGAVALGVFTFVYLAGRRRGRLRNATIQIKRV